MQTRNQSPQQPMNPDVIRGLNHAVTAALYLHKKDDDCYIRDCLLSAAYYLRNLQKKSPLEGAMLDVDFWLTNEGGLEHD